MKKKTLFILILIFTIFCFVVLLKGLDKDNSYKPDINFGKKLSYLEGKKLFHDELINSNELFDGNEIYVLNIWASWCVPCRAEHSTLMKLKSNKLIKIIGINYKDNLKNAKKFINEYGNPYSEILIDEDGTIAISLGAYGIPETIVVDKNQIILKKFFGAITDKSLKEINSLIK